MTDRRNAKVISVTPNLASFATPYSAGDVLGSVLTLSAVALEKNATAILESVVVLDKANQKAAIDLVIFDSSPANSIGADNAAYSLNDADLGSVVGRVSILAADYVSSGTANAEATIKAIEILIQASTKSKDLYLAVISRGTPTYGSASDLIIKLGFLQN
jgi:hypothetical protein